MFDFFKGSGPSAIEEVEAVLVQMVRDGRAVYDAALGAVFGGGKSKETKREVKTADREINVAQRDVRRALMVHSSVTCAVTASVDLPLVLTYMSIVKDAERIGDYAKNLYDIAKYGTDFEQAPDRAHLEADHETIGSLIDAAAEAFQGRNLDHAEALITRGDELLDLCDRNVRAAYESDGPASDAVARAVLPIPQADRGARDESDDGIGAAHRSARLRRRGSGRQALTWA